MISLKKTITGKKALTVAIAVLLAISIILYKLADRYLIEHVVTDNALQSAETSSGINISRNQENYLSGNEKYTADAWNYTSDTKAIHIKEVTTGSGEDKITYYVADVRLKASGGLKSAFARNQFGSNIIEYTSQVASDNNAVFAINGDYYGFRNDGIVIRNGEIFRDEGARTGLAFYKDGTMKVYDETATSAKDLLSQGVTQTLSFGPVLVENSQAVTNFGKTVIDTNLGNRSIQNSNPRTGVGIISANHYVFVVVDGRSPGYSKGMTLSEFAKVFEDLGCTDAYNLDGGGSSTMYFMGKVVNNPLGKGKERGVSDILYIS